jgi:membrane-anchored protein YejM (alkaline phosphatase superfamily)
MVIRNLKLQQLFTFVGIVLLSALGFLVALVLNGLTYLPWGNWHAVFNISLLFLVLGAYYGAVLGLDSRAGVSKLEHPVLRAALCGVLASTAVLLVQSWPPHTFNIACPVTGFVIGAVLGWFGWSWAKFIDF